LEIASASSEAAQTAPQRASLGAIVGVAIGLALLFVCVLAPVFYGSSTFAAPEGLAANFELEGLPHGFALEDTAYLLPGGERVFVFTDGSASPVAALDVVATASESAGEGETASVPGSPHGEGAAPFDWSTVAALSKGAQPARLFLVHYPGARAESVILEQFRGLEWKDLRLIGTEGGRSAVDGGQLQWGEYAADFVRERTYIAGGSFRDALRVNLSLGRECWVAYAIWPDLHAGSQEPVEELLAALRPRE
jgi:hypothetical protein